MAFRRDDAGRVLTKTVEGLRRCSACELEKPEEAFSRTGRGGKHVSAYCKSCYAARARAYYEANREQARARAKARYMENPEVRAAVKARTTAWRKENRERRREIVRRSYQADLPRSRANSRATEMRRRARKRAVQVEPITAAQLDARASMFGRRCWICRAPMQCMDHVKPIAAGGAHLPCNLRPACTRCNAEKGSKWPFPTLTLGTEMRDNSRSGL